MIYWTEQLKSYPNIFLTFNGVEVYPTRPGLFARFIIDLNIIVSLGGINHESQAGAINQYNGINDNVMDKAN